MPERLNGPPWKGGISERVSRVRISLSPHGNMTARSIIIALGSRAQLLVRQLIILTKQNRAINKFFQRNSKDYNLAFTEEFRAES